MSLPWNKDLWVSFTSMDYRPSRASPNESCLSTAYMTPEGSWLATSTPNPNQIMLLWGSWIPPESGLWCRSNLFHLHLSPRFICRWPQVQLTNATLTITSRHVYPMKLLYPIKSLGLRSKCLFTYKWTRVRGWWYARVQKSIKRDNMRWCLSFTVI